MLLLTGEYEHTIDEKNRLFISNKLRSQIDTEEYGRDFYFAMGSNGILCLYPEKHFQKIALLGSPKIGAPDEVVSYERLTFALASKVELDRQGRLLVNEKLKKRAHLGDALTLVGVRDHIEVWNTQDWERYLSDNISTYQAQVAAARQVQIQHQNREVEC